jgi:RNA polymerase sigma-70 factor (ECF subfamily)
MTQALALKAKSGDLQALDLLIQKSYQQTWQRVYRHLQHTDWTDDVTQTLFMKLPQKLAQFRGDSAFSTWFFRVIANECLDFMRSRTFRERQQQVEWEDLQEQPMAQTPSPDASLLASERKRLLQAAMLTLPEELRSIVILKLYEDWTFDQIAETYQVPLSTVKSRLYKALKLLRDEIDKRGIQ